MNNIVKSGKSDYTAVNITILMLIMVFLIMTILIPSGFEDISSVRMELLSITLLSLILITAAGYLKNETVKGLLQTTFFFSFFSLFYGFSSEFQLIISDWQDPVLINLDTILFGGEVSLLMQGIATPYLTEAMMFGYIMYFPLLILTAATVYIKARGKGLEEYLFLLGLGYALCYICFIFFPVAGMMYYSPESYSAPLEGGFFTYLGELVRSDAHFPGGNFPSPHCTAAAVMLFVLFKYNRQVYYIVLPVILLLFISTVYGRYHYIWDGIAGIILILFLVRFIPVLKKFSVILFCISLSIVNSPSISGSLTEN